VTTEARFRIQFLTLSGLILLALGTLFWAGWQIPRTERDALDWAGDLADRMSLGRAGAERIHSYEQARLLSAMAAEAQAEGGQDIGLRLSNLAYLHHFVEQRREAAEAATRTAGTWSAVTWWVHPITGRRTAVNATPDGRLDPEAVAIVKASLDIDVVVALARERAAQEAPLSPAERVARDLAALEARQ